MKIPQKPPDDQMFFEEKLSSDLKPEKLFQLFQKGREHGFDARYLHWDELRFRKPPFEWNHEEWWLALKIRRRSTCKDIPLKDKSNKPFRFCIPDWVADLLHQIDRSSGTLVQIPEQITNADQRDKYVIRSLMEEAITSSQLEGAATTREVAKKMLVEGRKPRDNSERMIANNYATMQQILKLKDQPLTPEMVFHIHAQIAQDALDIPDGAGRFRRPEEAVDVSDHEGTIFHVPPPAGELATRLQAMCDFANKKTPEFFIHPVIRGIILHFWLAYDHPFVDGNGRTARALFYWQMLNSGYWLFEFISISQFLRKAPVKYGLAFLHTETDENDLTYFIIHQTEVIQQALKELHEYIARKSSEARSCLAALEKYPELNHRQQALISHAIRHPDSIYNIAGHQTRQGITYATARSDLMKLVQAKLFEQKKVGRTFVFVAPRDLESRLQSKSVH